MQAGSQLIAAGRRLACDDVEVADGGDASDVEQERRVRQRRAWQWAQASRRSDGSLPSGAEVAREFRRCERRGRLVKKTGLAGQLDAVA